MPVIQDQLSQELTVFQPANRISGSSSRFGPDAGQAHARARSDGLAAHSVVQSRQPKNIALLPQVIS